MSQHPIAALTFALILGLAGAPAMAVQPDEMLPDPAKEAQARSISAELRCLVCQNQSIDDSDAPLARDLRLLVRERLQAGDSSQQVRDFLVARYGEFVLLRPQFNIRTLLLWLAPLLLLIGGGFMVYRTLDIGRGGKGEAPAPLNDAEKAKLADLLGDKRS